MECKHDFKYDMVVNGDVVEYCPSCMRVFGVKKDKALKLNLERKDGLY